MATPVAFRRTEAVFETDRMTIEHHLQQTASEHDITVATDTWRGSWTSLGATISYQWQIEPANGRYQVVERLFISKILLGLLVLPFVALAASFLWFTPYLTSPLYLAVILPTLIGAMLLGYGAVIIVVKAPSIIDQTRSINTNRTTQWPAVPLLIGLFGFLVIGFSSILVERWLVTVGVAVGTVIMGGAAVLWSLVFS